MNDSLLAVRDLAVSFPLRHGGVWGKRQSFMALEDVGLDVAPGQSVGIVGESGSGKSTLARVVLGLLAPAAGTVSWRGEPVRRGDREALRRMRRELQAVFQDPVGSLDPRMTIGESILEALEALEGAQPRNVAAQRVAASLDEVGLDAQLARRYPHQLSGGQCQRAAIARAIVARPMLLLCDEAVSALDVSVQAQIVNLLGELRRRHGLALLFISHNLAVVRHLCDEIVVLHLGRIVERAPCEALFEEPRHPYTRALLAAVPRPDPTVAGSIGGPAAHAAAPAGAAPAAPGGCAYAARCEFADATCRARKPELADTADGRLIACHHWQALPRWR